MEDLRLRLRPLAIRVDGRYHRGRIWEPRPDSAATEPGAVSNATTTPPLLRRDVLARGRRRQRLGRYLRAPGGQPGEPAVGDEQVARLSGRETCLAVVAVLSLDGGDASPIVPFRHGARPRGHSLLPTGYSRDLASVSTAIATAPASVPVV
jgi:hypothetical protein